MQAIQRSRRLDPVYTLERLVWRRHGAGWLTRPGAEPMHLVALPHFENDPVPSIGAPERYVGCTPYMLVRRASTADGLCRELHIDRAAELGEYWRGAPTESWLIAEPDPFAEPVVRF